MKRNYKFSILWRLARYSHPFIKGLEKRKIHRYARLGETNQPVFIVGAPRTGSTILYQLLTQCLPVLYINNFVELFYRDLYLGFWLSRIFLRDRPHNCFESIRGKTIHCGLKGPAECGDFWYRWLPREKHYIAENEIDENKREEMQKTIFAIINRYNKPLVFKNLNAGQRMGLISQLAPNAKFIFIKRNPIYTAQSIWLSRQAVGVQPHQWWSIMPKNYERLQNLGMHQQVVGQIFFLEKQILADRRYFPAENFVILHYEALCRDPSGTVDWLQRFIGPGIKKRKNAAIPELHLNEQQQINDKDFLLLKKEVELLDWKKYES